MSLAARVTAAERALAKRCAAPRRVPTGKYERDPIGYIENELKGDPWGKQRLICELLLKPPYRVLCEASHGVGKTWLAAALTSWHFDSFERGLTITTAPTKRDVEDLLWDQVRAQRTRVGLGGFRGEQAPELWDTPEHYAKGFTASKGESFQGRHPERGFFVFDEATGIKSLFWQTTKSMFKATGKHHWLAILNPTDTSSQAHAERYKVDANGDPMWHVVQMSTLDHPNIQAGLDGKPIQFPGAVEVEDFAGWLADWSDPIDPDDATETDLQWPPEWWRAKFTPEEPPRWWRPGPLMEGRALGRYPSAATYGVWSDRAWRLALMMILEPPPIDQLPQIGCDVALWGDDYTAMHVRWGCHSLHHERHNGWEYDETADRLKELADREADRVNKARPPQAKQIDGKAIPVALGGDAYGAAVWQLRDGYNFILVPEGGTALDSGQYFNRRTELWFTAVKRAKKGRLCLAKLPQEHQQRLRQQCFAPTWWPTGIGQHQVEPKPIMKKRLGHSPDDADAMNLAYAEVTSMPMAEVVEDDDPPKREERKPQPSRHNLFGRGR